MSEKENARSFSPNNCPSESVWINGCNDHGRWWCIDNYDESNLPSCYHNLVCRLFDGNVAVMTATWRCDDEGAILFGWCLRSAGAKWDMIVRKIETCCQDSLTKCNSGQDTHADWSMDVAGRMDTKLAFGFWESERKWARYRLVTQPRWRQFWAQKD